MKTNRTQLAKIRTHLNVKGFITSWDSIMYYRITRLSEYIRVLRHEEGMNITGERIYPPDANWYTIYTLNESK